LPLVVTSPVKAVVCAVALAPPVMVTEAKGVVAPTVLPKLTWPLPLVVVSAYEPSTAPPKATAALVLALLLLSVVSVVAAPKLTAPL
jgi:hypothetical protein